MADLTSLFSGGFVAAAVIEEVRQDPEALFLKELATAGFDIEHLDYDRIVRTKMSDDKRGEKSGWYIYYPGGIPAGAFGDWRSGETRSWCSKQSHEMTPAEWSENKRRMEQAKRERMLQIEIEQRAAAEKASNILDEAQPASNAHPYLVAKGVKAHGAIKMHEDKLIVPACNEDGEVTTIQTIDAAGNKRYLKGGKLSGAYFWIEGDRSKVYMCEGYATGATIHEATGCAVAVCFDAGNLIKTAPMLRGKFLTETIIVAADNDQHKPDKVNTGVRHGREAAALINANLVIPQFNSLDGQPTDFNDLAAREGLAKVMEQLGHTAPALGIKTSFKFSRVDRLELTDIRWIVANYMEADSLSLIFGEPGCGKSFVAIDLACCIATGTPWHGNAVKQGLVIYIAGEGHNGMTRRIRAWERLNGISLAGCPFYKSHRAAQLFDQASALSVAEAVRAIVEECGQEPAMIVVDTVARNMGGDENSTQDMNQFIEHLDALLRHPYKCCVLLVHHSGKASPGQARGSTALRGALDAEYMVEQDQDSRRITMTNKKMKDGEVPPEMSFAIKQIGLGVTNADGAEIAGAALEACDMSVLISKVKEEAKGLSANQNTCVQGLRELEFKRAREGMEGCVTLEDWRELMVDQRGMNRQRFHDAKAALVNRGLVETASGFVRICPEPDENGRPD